MATEIGLPKENSKTDFSNYYLLRSPSSFQKKSFLISTFDIHNSWTSLA